MKNESHSRIMKNEKMCLYSSRHILVTCFK